MLQSQNICVRVRSLVGPSFVINGSWKDLEETTPAKFTLSYSYYS